MTKKGVKILQVTSVAGVITLALASTPAAAHHDHDVVVPLVTGFALGAIAFHGHGHSHYHHSYRYHGHGYRYHRKSYRTHGHHGNHGHYRYRAKRAYSHSGHYRKPAYSHSHGGYHKPHRKRW